MAALAAMIKAKALEEGAKRILEGKQSNGDKSSGNGGGISTGKLLLGAGLLTAGSTAAIGYTVFRATRPLRDLARMFGDAGKAGYRIYKAGDQPVISRGEREQITTINANRLLGLFRLQQSKRAGVYEGAADRLRQEGKDLAVKQTLSAGVEGAARTLLGARTMPSRSKRQKIGAGLFKALGK